MLISETWLYTTVGNTTVFHGRYFLIGNTVRIGILAII